jgi:hypothetical protein
MKWLATTFLCLLTIPALAEPPEIPQPNPPEQKVSPLPMITQCTTVAPDQMLSDLYNEEVFLFGKGSIFLPNGALLPGKMRMFVSPDDKTYTVMFEVGELHCMVISGDIKEMFAPEQEL